jgi:hypothetical protein
VDRLDGGGGARSQVSVRPDGRTRRRRRNSFTLGVAVSSSVGSSALAAISVSLSRASRPVKGRKEMRG